MSEKKNYSGDAQAIPEIKGKNLTGIEMLALREYMDEAKRCCDRCHERSQSLESQTAFLHGFAKASKYINSAKAT